MIYYIDVQCIVKCIILVSMHENPILVWALGKVFMKWRFLMIEMLFHLLQKPTLWQRGSEPFWDDEHISKGMLEAHLNP